MMRTSEEGLDYCAIDVPCFGNSSLRVWFNIIVDEKCDTLELIADEAYKSFLDVMETGIVTV